MAQKIERIEAIDAEEEEQGLHRLVREAAEQATRRQVSRVLRNIKLPQAVSPYFAFLFRERRQIREFGRRTHVLETGLLPPGLHASPDIQEFLVRDLQSWAAELSRKLELVTQVGWLYLGKRRYNLAVLLKRLCERIVAFDFVHLNYRDRDLIDRMRRLESLFLALHYRAEYLEDLRGAIQIVYGKQGSRDDADGAIDLINRIMTPELTLPSLFNILLGLNMVKHRRYLTLEELMRGGLGEVVSSEEFSCEPAVRKRMEEFIKATVDSVKKLHEQLFEVRRLNSYLDYDDLGQPDARLLRGMYETPDSRGKHDFEADQEDVLLFTIRLLRMFDHTFFPLLNGHVLLESGVKAQIFSRGFFQLEFSRLRALLDRLEKGPFHFSNFAFQRYLQIKEGTLGAVGHEAEVVQILEDQVAILVDLGKTLSRVLGMSGLGAAAAPGKTAPLEPIVLHGKPFALPHAERRLQSASILNGRTVQEALGDAVSVCFTAGIHFRDRFIFFFLGRERKYSAEMQAKMRALENLLDAETLSGLRGLYG